MPKPSAPKMLMPAVWVIAIAVASVAVLLGGSSHLRSHRASAAKPVAQPPVLSAEQPGRVRASLEALPLAFEKNQGQTDPQVKYMARGNGYTVFLTSNETVFALSASSQAASSARVAGKRAMGITSRVADHKAEKEPTAAIHMRLVGGNPQSEIVAADQLPGYSNYFIGNDPSKWQKGVKQYAAVSYRDVYPGVNMAFHGEQRQLEFDFIVAAGAHTEPIRLSITGATQITTDASGNLVLSSAAGDVLLHKPVAYQEKDNARQPVDARFAVQANNTVSFELGNYDRSRELVIDPSVSYATYLGGSAEDEAFAIALDGSGNAYVTGQTNSLAFDGKAAGPSLNVFVTKVNSSGTAFAYTDIFAASGSGGNCSADGTGSCSGNAIAVDSTGNAYVAGSATAGFPTLSGFQTTFGGGAADGFVLKLNSSGTLVYSTYLGGGGDDTANAIAIDGSGNVYVAGETHSTNFPTKNPVQSSNASGDDAFVAKLNNSGASLAYSTYLGGSSSNLATGIALDASNDAFVTGITISSDFPTTAGVVQGTAGGADDGFVTEVKADGSAWVYSTYLGGSGSDDALGVAVDAAGEAFITGATNSTNFPTANPAQTALGGSSATNVFVTKLNAGGTALVFSTYYGGNLDDVGTAIALDSFGDAYVTGKTTSSNYPVSNAFQNSLSGTSDAFVTEFSNTGFVEYSSFMGGTGAENLLPGGNAQSGVGSIAVDSTSNAYVAGATASTTGFPTTAGVAQINYGGGLSDAFVAKVGPAPADFSVAVSPATVSTKSGQTASAVTVTVSSVNASYGQAVGLSCGNLPAKAVCNFSPTSVTPGSSAVTSSLTIGTNAAASASLLAPNANRHIQVLGSLLLPILGIAVLGAGIHPRRKKMYGLLFIGMILLGLITLPACGGSNNGGGGGGGTPPGTYRFTVSGAAGGVTHTAPLTLTVN